jgi:hypothetical protein
MELPLLGTAWTPEWQALIKGLVERFFNALESEGQSRKPTVNAYLMHDDQIWAAVLKLAEKLPVVGRMPGREVGNIITTLCRRMTWPRPGCETDAVRAIRMYPWPRHDSPRPFVPANPQRSKISSLAILTC